MDKSQPLYSLAKRLLIASETSLSTLSQCVVSALCELIGAEVACIYISNPLSGCLVLKAQHGIPEEVFQAFRPQCGEHCSQKIPINFRGEPYMHSLISSGSASLEGLLSDRMGLKERIAFAIGLPPILADDFPLLKKTSGKLETIGYVHLFFRTSTEELFRESSLASFIASAQELISSFWMAAVRKQREQVRRLIVDKSMKARDLNSVIYKAIHVVQEEIGYEAASVFLWDSDRKLLRLHSTTGLREKKAKKDVFYRKDEDDRVTLSVAKLGILSSTCSIPRDHKNPGRHEEFVPSKRQSFAAFPIFDWGATENPYEDHPIGVYRIINKTAKFGGVRTVVCFALDDFLLLNFVAEIFGVIINLMQRAVRTEDLFERVIHGFKSNLQAVNLNIGHLEIRPAVYEIKDERYKYILHDTIAIVKDLKRQVDRQLEWYRASDAVQSSQQRTLPCHPIRLTGDVLAKVKAMLPEMAIAQNAFNVSSTYENYEDFLALHEVYGNVDALITIFRNLFENALKYSYKSESTRPEIVLRQRDAGRYVEILVDDNGIGVPEGMEDWIFKDGFRCENAIRVKPAGGTGLGLAQSFDLSVRMGGLLYFERIPGWTRFVVRLRKVRGD